ncbi:penicillin-binding protein 1A [Fluviicoccus keumensis]|uniref:Penicillin-binding protein 1A n=2 Tax=Fluviicoccus keumensis TaxID=1435465 RepID=A0A4Q7ZA66_9GAMM|nr:penicillin-binding protein 1A [Fluviicoccus keumensis]
MPALLAATFAGLLSLILLGSGVYLYLNPQLPNVTQLREIALETPLQIYSSDGKLISEFGEKHSRPLKYAEIPPMFVNAFLAAEDDNFFKHGGISLKGLGRAFVDILQTGSIQSGGSTITMQVAKNYFLTSKRTFSRKFTEILLARDIEQALSKQEILALYVNKIFLGQRAYGIGAAAEVYYGKNVNQLSIAEMAMIAGLPKAPSKYNPVVNPKRALQRRDWILGRMLHLGFITEAQYQEALAQPTNLNFRPATTEVYGPWIAEMVRAALVARFGENIQGAGYRIYTTVQADMQNAAVKSVIDGLIAYDHRHGWRGPEANGQPLSDFYEAGGLQPAKVTAVSKRNFTALLKDSTSVRVDWEGMSWARPYKGVNSVGAYPANAGQIVHVDDIIRVRKSGNGWALAQIPAVQGQLIAVDPESGAIKALAGGFDYSRSQFNRSLQGWRQAGSTLKPFIYTLALERGYTPNSIINDAPLTIGNWSPSNSDGEFMGPITLRRALYLSRNLVSVRLLQAVGVDRARSYLDRFGFIDTQLPKNLTLALGTAQVLPVQMATAYSVIANGGYRINPYFIERIEDSHGKVLFTANPERICRDCEKPAPLPQSTSPIEITGEGTHITTTNPADAAVPAAPETRPFTPVAKRVMGAKSAYQMANILRDVIVHGTGRGALSLGRSDIAGKTGTTNDAKDAWFAGFNPHMVAIAWVGFDNPSPLGRLEYGGYAALPIWTGFMKQALSGIEERWLEPPEGMAPAPQPANNGGLPDSSTAPSADGTTPASDGAAPADAAQAAPEDIF